MGLRNKRPDLNGVLVVDKPLGWTSASVCGMVRRITRGAKVGHAGTLDPLATGVLVLCLGAATKSIPQLMASRKRYLATIDLSHTSATDDAEAPLQPTLGAVDPGMARVREALGRFVGTIQQVPPAHSAVWVDGERAYTLAREGRDPGLRSRPVHIESIELVAYEWPRLSIDVWCGKGTYIRSLARDVGAAMGVGGVLTALRRTCSGELTVEQARKPDDLQDGIESEDLMPAPSIKGKAGHHEPESR